MDLQISTVLSMQMKNKCDINLIYIDENWTSVVESTTEYMKTDFNEYYSLCYRITFVYLIYTILINWKVVCKHSEILMATNYVIHSLRLNNNYKLFKSSVS